MTRNPQETPYFIENKSFRLIFIIISLIFLVGIILPFTSFFTPESDTKIDEMQKKVESKDMTYFNLMKGANSSGSGLPGNCSARLSHASLSCIQCDLDQLVIERCFEADKAFAVKTRCKYTASGVKCLTSMKGAQITMIPFVDTQEEQFIESLDTMIETIFSIVEDKISGNNETEIQKAHLVLRYIKDHTKDLFTRETPEKFLTRFVQTVDGDPNAHLYDEAKLVSLRKATEALTVRRQSGRLDTKDCYIWIKTMLAIGIGQGRVLEVIEGIEINGLTTLHDDVPG
jgi:hypothetical protein